MRIAVAAILGAVALAATTSMAAAASLVGAPFILDRDPDHRWLARAYDDAAGQFAMLYSEAETETGLPKRLSFKLFDAEGKPIGSKTEVFDGRERSESFEVWAAGWFRLNGKNPLVALVASGENDKNGQDIGLLGQFLEKRQPVGPRISLDAQSLRAEIGGLIRLNDGRGLAVWTTSREPSSRKFARFISDDGKPDKNKIEIFDNENLIYDIHPFASGFMIIYFKSVDGDYKLSYQIFDAEARKVGVRKNLAKTKGFFPHVVGLNDGSVVVAQLVDKIFSSELTIRTYAVNGKATSESKVIQKNLRDFLQVAALPEGGFLVATSPKHDGFGNLIKLVRYDAKLRQVGDSAQITAEGGDVKQLLALQNGNALVVYMNNRRLTGQLVKP